MKVVIGKTYKDLVSLDFKKTPHVVGGGTSGYGKTNLIKVIMTGLIDQYPNDVEFDLLDLKGGVEFGRYELLRQVRSVSSNVEEATLTLESVLNDMGKTQKHFRRMGWNNINETPINKRRFVIVDEAGEFVPESFMTKDEKDLHKYCQAMFSKIARLGRAFGFHILLFSQYTTSDVLPRQVKMNADAKVCFRTPNGYASEVMLDRGNTDAARLDDVPGRAIFLVGARKYEIQVPEITDDIMQDLLAPYYESARKDVTGIVNESTREDFIEIIKIGDSAS